MISSFSFVRIMSSPHVWPFPRCPNPQQPGLQEYEGVAGQRGTLDMAMVAVSTRITRPGKHTKTMEHQ